MQTSICALINWHEDRVHCCRPVALTKVVPDMSFSAISRMRLGAGGVKKGSIAVRGLHQEQ